MNKKIGVILLSVLVFSMLLTTLVVAQEVGEAAATFADGVVKVIDQIVKSGEPIFSNLLGETPGGEHLFAKALFFIIILSIIWISLDRVEIFATNTWALAIVSLAGSVLAIRFIISREILEFMILPYSAFGVIVSAFLPLLVYFYIVEKAFTTATMRKIAWVFAIVVFSGLWITREEQIGNLAWIYLITAILSLIFLLADKTIKRALVKANMEAWGVKKSREYELEIRRKIKEAKDDLTSGIVTPTEHAKIMKSLRKKMVALHKT